MLSLKSKSSKSLKEIQILAKNQLIRKTMESAVKGGAGKADIVD